MPREKTDLQSIPLNTTIYLNFKHGADFPQDPYTVPSEVKIRYSTFFHYVSPWLRIRIATVSALIHQDCPVKPGMEVYVNGAILKPIKTPGPRDDGLQNSFQRNLI